MEVVADILQKSVTKDGKYKSIEVKKHLDVVTDPGKLYAFDPNDLDVQYLRRNTNDYLLNLTRDNTQLLLNQIWELPTERHEDAIVVKLPKPQFVLPRSKPVPKPRVLTKWEEFAKSKGIQKKKKSKLTWDEELQRWVPLFGFKRAKAQKEKDWVLEVPENADPLEDQFAKKAEVKSEKVAKNELQRLRNIAKARKIKVPRMGLLNPDVSSAKELQTAVTVAKSSTASLGKFQEKLPKEKEARGVAAITPGASRKRKLPPVPAAQEKSENLTSLDAILNKRPKVDIEKAVSRHINEEQQERSREKQQQPKSSGRKQQKTKSGTKGKKPKSGKGQRKKGKGGSGRKRR